MSSLPFLSLPLFSFPFLFNKRKPLFCSFCDLFYYNGLSAYLVLSALLTVYVKLHCLCSKDYPYNPRWTSSDQLLNTKQNEYFVFLIRKLPLVYDTSFSSLIYRFQSIFVYQAIHRYSLFVFVLLV